MKNTRKKKKSYAGNHSNSVQEILEPAFPTASEVAADRAKEAAYERELAALGEKWADCSDSGSSDGEARLLSVLRPLQLLPLTARPRPLPAATALLPQLASAIRITHPDDAHFLDEYIRLLNNHTELEVQTVTDELMQSIECALSVDDARCVGGVVLATWLGAAAVWRVPRVPAALSALHSLLQHFSTHQLSEVARALHAAMEPLDIIAVSDAVRGAARGRGEELAALLLRAALFKLLRIEPDWQNGRVLVSGPRQEAGVLLAAFAPPPPSHKDRQDPDYLKISGAVKTLQNLFKDM